jgi:poly(ADP-ribose) glycohydrolase ARH3
VGETSLQVISKGYNLDMEMKDKIQGMFLGTFIGDALGFPVEGWSSERIAETYGRIISFVKPDKHKWFGEKEVGTPTDDWQLTKAVAESLIISGMDMDAIAEAHKAAFNESIVGWGGTTSSAVRNLLNGATWEKSGLPIGMGNGCAMKIAPVAALVAAKYQSGKVVDFIVKLTCMTHRNVLAVCTTLAQAEAIYYCLTAQKFNAIKFANRIIVGSVLGEFLSEDIVTEGMTIDFPDTTQRLKLLKDYKKYDDQRIIKEFQGTAYAYNSIPFSLMFFIRNPNSINAMYDVIAAGGDTDTNASMVGSLLGALNGVDIFPMELVNQMSSKYRDEVTDVANRFYNKFFEEK